jgi:hypothetical protein
LEDGATGNSGSCSNLSNPLQEPASVNMIPAHVERYSPGFRTASAGRQGIGNSCNERDRRLVQGKENLPMFRGRFWEEIRERFPEMNDAELKRFVGFRIFFYALVFIVMLFLNWFFLENNLYISLFALIVTVFQTWFEWRWPGFRKKLEGTLFRKIEVGIILFMVAVLLVVQVLRYH